MCPNRGLVLKKSLMENFIFCAVSKLRTVHLSKVKIFFECGALKEVDICHTLRSFNTIAVSFNSNFHTELSLLFILTRYASVNTYEKVFFFFKTLAFSNKKDFNVIYQGGNSWKMPCITMEVVKRYLSIVTP